MEVTPFSKRFIHFQGGPVKEIILHTQATNISIHLNLLGPFSDGLRYIPILRDLSCHADALSLVLALWCTKFAPIGQGRRGTPQARDVHDQKMTHR